MIRWVVVLLTILFLSSAPVSCEIPGLGNDADHIPQLLSNSSQLLSQLIREFILDPHGDNCSANLISGGFISLKNETWPTVRNYTVSTPSLFVTCTNSIGGMRDYSKLLKNFATTVASLEVIDDSNHYLEKDDFRDSILMIAFTSCAICVGMWMVYLVLLFQRCPQHAGRRFLVMLYVVFAAIYESINLNKAVQKIFKKQYSGNYQDSVEYETIIIDTNAYRVGEIITNFLACVNWISIVYYMFQNCNKIHKRWLPHMVANRNRIIVWVGLSLTLLEELFFALLLWYSWNNGLRITFLLTELCIYVLLGGLTCYFVYHDFGFILSPRKPNNDNRSRVRQIWTSLWNDYHETLPLLIYKSFMFALLFFTEIYFYVTVDSERKWKFKVIKFFKVVITVSIWGLIAVLEKRELIVSKETVLGRKIQNSDRFFYDVDMVKYDSNCDSSTLNSSDCDIEMSPQSSSSTEDKADVSMIGKSRKLLRFKVPTRAWQSQLERAKRRRKIINRTRQKFLNVLAGTNRRKKDENPKIFKHDLSENGSVETELETNYIYDLHDSDSTDNNNNGV